MRRFSPEYLETTRTGMWEDSREALADLGLSNCERVLDVGAGTGELTSVLRQEVSGETVALDADLDLLTHVDPPRLLGDATRLPFEPDSFDLVVCQALLVNLPAPTAAIEEFTRVSRNRVAAIEPDNSAVSVESTVDEEPVLNKRARTLYLDGVETDATLGNVRSLFLEAGLQNVSVRRYDHVRRIEPPYSEVALESARKKASGAGLDTDRGTILAGDATPETFEELRQQWRAMGRRVIDQMQDRSYRQQEQVPFFVTVGQVPAASTERG